MSASYLSFTWCVGTSSLCVLWESPWQPVAVDHHFPEKDDWLRNLVINDPVSVKLIFIKDPIKTTACIFPLPSPCVCLCVDEPKKSDFTDGVCSFKVKPVYATGRIY